MASKRTKHLYDSPKWRKLRKRLFRKDPLCVLCREKGKITAATELDHRIPSSKLPLSEFFNEDNLQFLCYFCHREKTTLEVMGSGRMTDCDENGLPIGLYDDNGYFIGKKNGKNKEN